MRLSSMPYYASVEGPYRHPEGFAGIGKDIKWCNHNFGGKRCMLCHHHATFDIWSQEWHWYYLTSWYSNDSWYKGNKKYPAYYERSEWKVRWTYHSWTRCVPAGNIKPKRYGNTGISDRDIKSLLKKGCRKKCKCASLVQRGNWYCPDCYKQLEFMSHSKKIHIHDLMIADRDEIKKEMLINSISGINT